MELLKGKVRLSAVFSVIDKSSVIMDIGCDHGYLTEALVLSNRADKYIACDISLGSLNKAKALLSNYSNVDFLLADGEQAIKLIGNDITNSTVAICGMGGKEIIKILGGVSVLPKSNFCVVLQPQKNADNLRKYLCESGYSITHDFVVEENNKFYDILRAEFCGESTSLSLPQLNFGVFYKIFQPCLAKRITKVKQDILSYKQTSDNKLKLKIIAEVEKWQKE